MRTDGVNQAFRFVEVIRLHRKSQIRFFPEKTCLHHKCATTSEIPFYISTTDLVDISCRNCPHFSHGLISLKKVATKAVKKSTNATLFNYRIFFLSFSSFYVNLFEKCLLYFLIQSRFGLRHPLLYYVSEKSCPLFIEYPLYKNEQNFLYTQYPLTVWSSPSPCKNISHQIRIHFLCIPNMVLILDGNSEIDAHVCRNLCYMICLRHLFNSKAIPNLKKKRCFHLHMRNMLWVTM